MDSNNNQWCILDSQLGLPLAEVISRKRVRRSHIVLMMMMIGVLAVVN